jgi:glycosyltransferase involved in cell wall biosynthesis
VRDPGTLTLALSRFLAARLAARDGLAAEVLAPIIDPERQRSEGPRDTVLFVNPIPQKGWAIAVAVAERLRDTRFIVLESWPLTETWRQHWLERIAGLGNIEWRAAVADMRPIWARTRVLLMPSLWEEGWGMVASEAQVSGIPVVASHRGGLPEAVGPGGVILDADAPAAQWAGAVSRLMTDDGQHAAVAAAARRHAARPELRPDAVAGRFLSLVSAHAERYRRGTVS